MKAHISFDDDPKINRFVQYIGLYCESNDVDLHFSLSKRIKGCSGLFWDDPPKLEVAIGKKKEDWLQILVHEFSHCIQWNEDQEKWNLAVLCDGTDAYSEFQSWFNEKKELNKKQINKYSKLSRLFEQDCDKKAVHLIKTWNLPINVEKYIQKSNAYHIFYEYIKESREWYPKNKAPYEVDYIWTNMPTEWVEKPAEDLIQLYRDIYSK